MKTLAVCRPVAAIVAPPVRYAVPSKVAEVRPVIGATPPAAVTPTPTPAVTAYTCTGTPIVDDAVTRRPPAAAVPPITTRPIRPVVAALATMAPPGAPNATPPSAT